MVDNVQVIQAAPLPQEQLSVAPLPEQVNNKFDALLDSAMFGPNNWANRRKVIWACFFATFGILFVVSAAACYALINGQSVDVIISTIIFGLLGFLGTITTGYIFSATTDQTNFRDSIKSLLGK